MNKEDKLYIVMLSKLVEELIPPTPQAPPPNSNPNTERTQSEEQSFPEKRQKPNQEECSEINQEKGESHDKEQDTSLKKEQIDAIGKAWLFFANSIMSGEFLSYSDYSRELDHIINTIRSYYDKSTDGDPSNPTPYLHPVLAAIHDLCFRLRTLCMLMRIQIKIEKEKESVLAISSPLPPQWSSTNSEGNEISRLVDWLKLLVEGLIEMTEIDFTCHTNKAKIRSLHSLFEACKQTSKVTALRGEVSYTPFTEAPLANSHPIGVPYGEALLNTIRCKCSLLAYQSIFKIRQGEEEILFSSTDTESLAPIWKESQYKGREAPYQAVEKALFIVNGDRHSALTLSSDNESIFGFWKNNLYHYNYKLNSSIGRKHIVQYNEYIGKSQKIRKTYSKVVAQIQGKEKEEEKEKTLDINELTSIISQHKDQKKYGDPPIEFLLTCMRAIEGIGITPKSAYEELHARVKLLGDLSLSLHELKTRYEGINQPYEQTRRFEDSFFTCDPERPIPFFIASLGCKYINPDWLEERDVYYNGLLRLYRIRESEALSESLRERTEKAINDERTKNASDLKEQQRDYLTLLGIFSALITLAVSLVTTFKLAETIWDYMAMLSGAYVLIGILVIVLYLRNSDEDSDKNSDKSSDKESDKESDKNSDKSSDKSSDKERDKNSDKESDKNSDKESDKESDKNSDKNSDKKEGTSTIALMKNSMIVAAIIGTLGVGVKGYKEIFPSPKSEKDASNEDVYKAGTINQVHIGIPREESAASPRHSQMLKTNTDSLATGGDSKEARLGESKVK